MNSSPETLTSPSPYKELLNICDQLAALPQAKDLSPQEFEAPELGAQPLGREITFPLTEDEPNETITVAWFSDEGRQVTTNFFDTEHPVLGIISFNKATESIRFFGDILVLDNGQLAVEYRHKIDDMDDVADIDDFARDLGLTDIWEEAATDPNVINLTYDLSPFEAQSIPVLVETLTWSLQNLQNREE